jgi:DNA-binding GntR family transcriptional regulator
MIGPALALALGASQRTVQRALDALAAAGKVQSFGRGRARQSKLMPSPVAAMNSLDDIPVWRKGGHYVEIGPLAS